MSSRKSFINNRFYLWFTKANLHHVFLWVIYFSFWAYFYRPGVEQTEIFVNSFVIVTIHAMVSYFNIYFLFPNFLQEKHYTEYFVALILSIGLGSFIQAAVFLQIDTISPEVKNELFTIGFLLTAAMAITYTTAITMSLKLVKHWYENERLAKDLEKINTETELKYLKSQINPHFLFNSLNSIYSLSLKKSDLAPDLILKLSDILRYLLYEGSEKKVSLGQEVKYLKSFLELEKVRHGDRMDLNITVEGDVDSKDIAPMLLIPFVENSFKHGLGKDRSRGYVNVDLKLEGERLLFSIKNSKPKNGQEISKQKGYTGGIGLINVKKRLNLLYPNKHKLEIGEAHGEFAVTLTLELN